MRVLELGNFGVVIHLFILLCFSDSGQVLVGVLGLHEPFCQIIVAESALLSEGYLHVPPYGLLLNIVLVFFVCGNRIVHEIEFDEDRSLVFESLEAILDCLDLIIDVAYFLDEEFAVALHFFGLFLQRFKLF